MIIMINGAFGSGKTNSANLLKSLIPNSMIFNPEEIGYMLRNLLPEAERNDDERTDDFQDIELWRVLTVQVARELRLKYNRHLIVPMTIYKPVNFEYIYNGFKGIDNQVYHFCLIASEKTLKERLTKRGDIIGGWQFQQIDKCINTFQDNKFKKFINTDDLEIIEVVNQILMNLND